MSLLSTLFVIFLILKLTSLIDWSWWWVTSPLWIPFAAFGALSVIIIVIFAVMDILGIRRGGWN